MNYDTNFTFSIGKHQFLCLNTGQDRYPRQEEFIDWDDKEDEDKDYIAGGPHNRGITNEHVRFLRQALTNVPEHGLIFIFTHAPLVGLENDETKGMDVLFEENHKNAQHEAVIWLEKLYKKSPSTSALQGFPLTDTTYFKQGKRDPYLNFSCADGKVIKFLDMIARVADKTTDTPILVFSGHTHEIHEFRIEKIKETQEVDKTNFYYFLNDYSGKYFRFTTEGLRLFLRWMWQKVNSPLLFTSGALKHREPQYREIIVNGQIIVSLEMKTIPERNIVKTANFTPGCRSIALKTWSTGKYICAEEGGGRELVANRDHIREWETFELIKLEDNKIALRAYSGQFVRAEGGGGGKVKADRSWIKSHEIFEIEPMGDNKFSLRTLTKGKYVSIKRDGIILADQECRTSKEAFVLIELD